MFRLIIRRKKLAYRKRQLNSTLLRITTKNRRDQAGETSRRYGLEGSQRQGRVCPQHRLQIEQQPCSLPDIHLRRPVKWRLHFSSHKRFARWMMFSLMGREPRCSSAYADLGDVFNKTWPPYSDVGDVFRPPPTREESWGTTTSACFRLARSCKFPRSDFSHDFVSPVLPQGLGRASLMTGSVP